jgi:hypothetical protein
MPEYSSLQCPKTISSHCKRRRGVMKEKGRRRGFVRPDLFLFQRQLRTAGEVQSDRDPSREQNESVKHMPVSISCPVLGATPAFPRRLMPANPASFGIARNPTPTIPTVNRVASKTCPRAVEALRQDYLSVTGKYLREVDKGMTHSIWARFSL